MTSGWNTLAASCTSSRILLSSAATVAACCVALTLGSSAGAWPGSIGVATLGSVTLGGALGAGSSRTPLTVFGSELLRRCRAPRISGVAASNANSTSAASTA